jgi:two-component system sensor histidine kinase ResE
MDNKLIQQQQLLLEITAYFSENSDLSETIERVLFDLCQGTDAVVAQIVLEDGYVFSSGLAGVSLQAKAAPLHQVNGIPGVGAVMGLPLLVRKVQQGILMVGFGSDQPVPEYDRAFIEIVAGKAALAIANARAYDGLEASQRRLEALLSSITDAVIMVDNDGSIQVFNPAAEVLFKTKVAQAVNRPLSEIIKNEAVLHLLDENDLEARQVFIDMGSRTYQPLLSEVMDDDHQRIGRVLILADVSHLRRLNENMTLFLQTVSHDLRSPLTAAKGFVDMLGMVGQMNDKQVMMQEKILTSITDMTNLVEKVLDAGRLDPEMGAYELRRDLCDPSKVVNKVVSTMTPVAQKKHIHLKSEVDGSVPMMNLDEMMLERALWNLVENAVKYTPEQGEVVVRAKINNNHLVLSVEDNGYGIPGDKLPTLFEKGSRVRREEHKAIRGSGLGLFIVKNVARQHGGDAHAESKEGQGSAFIISIPIAGENIVGAAS